MSETSVFFTRCWEHGNNTVMTYGPGDTCGFCVALKRIIKLEAENLRWQEAAFDDISDDASCMSVEEGEG